MLPDLTTALAAADAEYANGNVVSSYFTFLWTAVHRQEYQTKDDCVKHTGTYVALIDALVKRGRGEGISLKIQQFGAFEDPDTKTAVMKISEHAAQRGVQCIISALQVQGTLSEFAMYIKMLLHGKSAGLDTRLLGYCLQMDLDVDVAEFRLAQTIRQGGSIRLVKGGWFRDANLNRYPWQDVTERYAGWALALAIHGFTLGHPHVIGTHDIEVAKYLADRFAQLTQRGWKPASTFDVAHTPCFACFGIPSCRGTAAKFPTTVLKRRVAYFYGQSSLSQYVMDSVATLDLSKVLVRRCNLMSGPFSYKRADSIADRLLRGVLCMENKPLLDLLHAVLVAEHATAAQIWGGGESRRGQDTHFLKKGPDFAAGCSLV